MNFQNCKTFVLFLGVLFFIAGCEKFNEQDKFERPDWLPGKLYTTVSVQGNLTLFTECIKLTGLDSILDVSGSWTVFAPDDEAMKQYLAENHYSAVSDIPVDKLEKIVKFHIVQNPWSLEQLQSLSPYGWRTGNSKNSYLYAFKRQTMLKNSGEKYWIQEEKNRERIVTDSVTANAYKRVFVGTRKNVPVFYDAFMDINGITSEDFSFYFGRPYEHGNVYYAGAKILQSDIFAENGFVHIIDRVVNPMLNAKELLEQEFPGESYKLFLEMVYWYYPSFAPNMAATFNQPAVRAGGLVDTLWDLNYSRLAFAIQKEGVGYEGPEINETFVRHNGLIVPADNPLREFIDGTLTLKSGFPHWRNYKSLPQDVVDIIVSRLFSSGPVYPSTNIYQQVFTGKGGFQQNEEDIIRQEFGSNCTFIGLNSYTPDRVFTSVTGPVFCRPDYSLFRQAILYCNIGDVIANHEGELYFFPIPDYALRADSSLILNWIDKDENQYSFSQLNRRKHLMEGLGRNTIRTRIMNHVGISVSGGSAGKETIQTLGGRYITWDHSNNTIQGSRPSTIGYDGEEAVTSTPVRLEEPADNGKVWSVNYWFNF